ncbi:MAG: DUF2442 domain-containing protein [Acidobacteriota bacterium]
MYTIEQIKTLPDFLLELNYSDGGIVVADFKPIIAKGGVFSVLADPQVFNQVRLGERGRYIEWPDELDFCADSFRVNQAVSDGKAAEIAVATAA